MSDETRSIRVIPFSGTHKSEYCPWKIKRTAIGSKYGWVEALKADLTHDEIGAALTDAFKEEQNANDQAVTYLVLLCTDNAFNTVTNGRVYKNAYEVWESLRKKFEADNYDELVCLIAEFVESRLMSNKEDPKEWILRI
jgi:hypothetical protein